MKLLDVLAQQAGFVDIAEALKARAGEIGITKKGEGLQHTAYGWRARQVPRLPAGWVRREAEVQGVQA